MNVKIFRITVSFCYGENVAVKRIDFQFVLDELSFGTSLIFGSDRALLLEPTSIIQCRSIHLKSILL